MSTHGSVLVRNDLFAWQHSVEQDGYSVIPQLFTGAECDRLIEQLAHSHLTKSRAGLRHAMQHPAVASLARDERLMMIARAVLGDGAQPYRATLFDKSPDSNWLVVWHQDTALPLQTRFERPGWGPWSVKDGVLYAHAPASALTQVVALRLHLDESRLDNGPLKVLPGTHKHGVLTDDEVGRFVAEMKPVMCLTKPGGVLAMRPLLIHASSKSQSQSPRRVLHIEYAGLAGLGSGIELAIV